MPDYRVTFSFVDVLGGETRKTFFGTFADYATATAATSALSDDIQALVTAGLQTIELTEISIVASAPAGSSNVFERVSASVELNAAGKKYNLQMPSPVPAIFTSNALITDAALWTSFVANLTTGNWTISDGEHYHATINGKRIFVRSGSTNL